MRWSSRRREGEQLLGARSWITDGQAEVAAVDQQVVPHRQLGVEVVLLGDHAEAGRIAGRRRRGPGPRPTGRRRYRRDAGDHAHGRGLAGAVGPEEPRTPRPAARRSRRRRPPRTAEALGEPRVERVRGAGATPGPTSPVARCRAHGPRAGRAVITTGTYRRPSDTPPRVRRRGNERPAPVRDGGRSSTALLPRGVARRPATPPGPGPRSPAAGARLPRSLPVAKVVGVDRHRQAEGPGAAAARPSQAVRREHGASGGRTWRVLAGPVDVRLAHDGRGGGCRCR